MNKAQYIRVRLMNVPAHLEDIITTHSFECGALGVSEALAYSQPDLRYDPRITFTKSHNVDVFFEERPAKEFFEGLTNYDSKIQWSLFEEEQKDWLAEWKKGFKPFSLAGPYWVVPSWEEIPADAKKPLRIDPGMAFGTGTHATTQMMAALIYKLSEKYASEISNWSLMDVGTGTAILAMMAKLAGFAKVHGVEIDPEARRTARQNLELNHLSSIEIFDQPLDEIRGAYEVTVANIIDGVLIQLQKDLLRVTKPDGHLLVTGILTERDDEFFQAFIENNKLKVIRRLEKDEWVGYWLRSEGATTSGSGSAS